MASPEERICRAGRRRDGHPESITFEGAPMWQSYKDAAGAVLIALALEPLLAIVREVGEWFGETRDAGSVPAMRLPSTTETCGRRSDKCDPPSSLEVRVRHSCPH